MYMSSVLEKLRGGTVPSVELKENQVVGVAASCHGTGSSLLFNMKKSMDPDVVVGTSVSNGDANTWAWT